MSLPPRVLVFTGALLALLLLVPPFVIARVRAVPSEGRPIHIFWDMDFQPKFKAQSENTLFADRRAARPEIPGTVALGEANLDVHLNDGVAGGGWASTVPASITLDERLLERGRQRFNIYCSVCHGYSGYGDGIVNRRALALMENSNGPVQGTAWVAAKSLHDPTVREQPIGQIYNTIKNGVRNMAGYGAQVPVEDRWAIAAYVQALQVSQDATIQDVPPDRREALIKR